jgi:ADP-heptose:LPS heptosyltransferase
MDAMNLGVFREKSMDYVFSENLLQELNDPGAALKEWWRVLKTGGYLSLVTPVDYDFKETLTALGGWEKVEDEVRKSVRLTVLRKLKGGKWVTNLRQYDPNTVLVVRYGGFGDMVQSSSVIAGLKQSGWKVWVNTTPKGKDVLRNDPNIDGWWLQDTDQVPNEQLTDYWRALGERFGKVVNLSESVEGRFLVLPGRPESEFPVEILRAKNGGNYNDYACDLAGVPRQNQVKFYPNREEREWVEKQRKKLGEVPVILWVLSGSSIHKMYPWTDNVVATLMTQTDAKVVFVGDNLCQLLEDGWKNEPRVWGRSGQWSIRETLAFAQQADVVVGPETGVLNAVAMEKVGKVLMLSHSTVENLSRDWVNTVNLTSSVDCYPCHRLHYGFEYCRRDELTHASECAASIQPEAVYDAIVQLLPGG